MPEKRTLRVEVPVLMPCRVQEVVVPLWTSASLKKVDPLVVKVRGLLGERWQRIEYEKQMEAVVKYYR